MTAAMRVRIERGPSGPSDFSIRASERVAAGRGRDCGLLIADASLSRRHFELLFDGRVCRLIDLGSSNGTFVNGQRVQQTELRDGDRIEAGATLLRVEIPPPPSQPLTPPAPLRRPQAPPAASSASAVSPAALAPAPRAPRPTHPPVEIYASVPRSQTPPPAAHPRPGTPLGELARLLAEAGDAPLYALIDCAAALDAALGARMLGLKLYSLFAKELAEQIGHSGPALVPLGDEPLPFLADWAARSAKNPGVLLDAHAPLEELHAHLVGLFEVSDAAGNGYFRRFYDPRVLRPLIASTSAPERPALFGPVERFIVADERGAFVALARASGKPA